MKIFKIIQTFILLVIAVTLVTGCSQGLENMFADNKIVVSAQEKEELINYSSKMIKGMEEVLGIVEWMNEAIETGKSEGEVEVKVMIAMSTLAVLIDDMKGISVPEIAKEPHSSFKLVLTDPEYVSNNITKALVNDDIDSTDRLLKIVSNSQKELTKGMEEMEKIIKRIEIE
jgi:hypothetical protein